MEVRSVSSSNECTAGNSRMHVADGTIGFDEFANFYSKCLGSAESRDEYVEKLEKRYGRAMGLTDDELLG